VGDHFGWHPSTGPDVDKREGHSFVGNLLVADESFRKPLARFEQTQVLCGKLTRPHVTNLDGNVYVRLGVSAPQPLLFWGPVAGEKCQVELESPEALRALQPSFEKSSRLVSGWAGALFKSPELANYEPLADAVGTVPGDAVPAAILKILGWAAAASRAPGAYPVGVR
jgi:hypothetical protein